MPAWPGGTCPVCGDYMPPKLIHCQSCRTLLNPELERDSVEIPEFQPLQEISAMIEVQAAGYFVQCPACQQELRINKRYLGQNVACKFCDKPFALDPQAKKVRFSGFFARCPHCDGELRAALKYMDQKVVCKFCDGHIHFIPEQSTPATRPDGTSQPS